MGKRVLCAVLALVMLLCLLPATSIRVQAASAMTGSEDILNYIKSMEGFIAVPQWDIAQWTVGYGTRCPDEDLERYLAEGIPLDEAEALFRKYIAVFEGYVNRFIDENGLTLNQHQFDAVLSLSYNCGISWMYNNSSLYKAIVGGATGNSLIGVMSQYCTAGGSYLSGLMRRRLTEANIYLNGVYSVDIPDSYCYVFYNAGNGKASAVAQGYDSNLYAEPVVTATYDGHTFVGWYTSAVGGMKVSYLDENMNGMTLYAHWQQGNGSGDVPDGTIIDAVLVTVTGDIVNVRSGPGISYSAVGRVTAGTKIAITEVAVSGNRLWGKFDQGWICLEYTNYEEVIGDTTEPPIEEEGDEDDFTVPELPIYARILGTQSLSVHNGPHNSYPVVRTLTDGDRVQIVELYEMFSTWWGRIEGGGWIKLNFNVMLEDESTVAHSFEVTVTNYNLNVRDGAGIENTWLTSFSRGDKTEIFAVEIVDDQVWGRCSPGWICLVYTDFDSSKLEQYWHHSYGQWYVSEAATCVTNGTEQRDCLYCSNHETRVTDLADHSYGQWYVTEESTCVTNGTERRDCQICSVSEFQELALGDHSFGAWYEVEAATCVSHGVERRDCVHCDVWENRETDYGDHSYGEWYVETAPTCEASGVNRRECQHCGEEEREEIPATGHSMGQWYETVAPTLTEYGEERCDCQWCDYFEVRTLDPVEHLFDQWYVVTAPTCTEAGEERRDCTECDHFESRTIEALGHRFGQWYVVTAPTCTEAGEERRDCTVCGHCESRTIEELGHSFGQWYVGTAPTCTEAGEECRECASCGRCETRPIEALGHSFGEWIVVNEGNCQEGSLTCRSCATCGYTEMITGDPVAHTFGEWYVFSEPTCIRTGERRRECAECGHYESEEIATVDHSLGQWYTAKEPSCSAEGQSRRDCQWCDHYEAVVLAMLEHSYGAWYVSVEATYTTPGEERRDCENCSAYMVRQTEIKLDTVLVTYATITHTRLNVRSGPGTSYALVGTLRLGDRVRILNQTTVANMVWGQYEGGWICLTGYTSLETVEEQVVHSHTFGQWYTVVAATTTETGLERRDCTRCDYYEERETEKLAETVTKVYGTLIGYRYLNIRESASTNSAKVGQLNYGDRVEILEQVTLNGNVWGRIEQGWILITGYMVLETVEESTAPTKVYGTLTGHSYLNIRASASSNSEKVGQLKYGDRVEILAQVTVGGNVWGRIEQGWIMITGYMTLETVNDSAEHTHSFGAWYTVTEATCTAAGQQRRDCACGYSETSTIAATGHSFGAWYTVTEATADANGLERRDCACGHSETRETEKLSGSTTKVYGTLTGYSYLRIRSGPGVGYDLVGQLSYGDRVEILEIRDVGNVQWARIQNGWVQITGYLTLETVEESPEEGERVFMTVNTSVLNVRAGAGVSYALVTTLVYGTEVEILDVVYVNGTAWARIPLGWVCMIYLV